MTTTPKAVTMLEINCPPAVAPFMDRHGKRGLQALTDFLRPCKTTGEKLGALGALSILLLAYGDSIQAMELSKAEGTKQ